MKVSATVMYDAGGYYVEWYTDDDGASGYGDNPKRTYWYGSRAECEKLANGNPPRECAWQPITGWRIDTSPGSAAWCEDCADNS